MYKLMKRNTAVHMAYLSVDTELGIQKIKKGPISKTYHAHFPYFM